MSLADIVCQKAAFLRDQGMISAARGLLQDNVADSRDCCPVLRLLSEICALQGDYAAAATHLEAATALDSGNLESNFLLGVAYENLGQYEKALCCFDKVRTIAPGIPLPFRWRGLTLTELGRYREAFESYAEALRIDPNYPEAKIGLASLLIRQHRLEEAEPLLAEVISAEPANTAALNELSRVFRLQGRGSESVALLRNALRVNPSSRMIASNLLYNLCDLGDISPEDVAREYFELADRLYPPVPTTGPGSTSLRHEGDPKLRIGYMSGDFCTHSVASFLEPILAAHDYDSFSIYCYSNTHTRDETTARLKSYPTAWRDIYGMSAEAVAATICGDEIDILVELSGHTAGNRLDVCALKPAPVMVSWLGYPHSSGLSQIDYYLTDSLCDPPGLTDHLYREQLWRLPSVFCCYRPPECSPDVPAAPQKGTGAVTFGCFNNFSKVTDSMLMLWGDLLRRVEGSILLLKSHAVGEAVLQRSIRSRLGSAGIAPDRIRFHPYTDTRQQHLALYGKIDVALDTYPYHGTTTTCEALYMGVPVVTLAGKCHAARVGVSLLSTVGLADLIAGSPEEYVDAAVRMANDAARRASLRKDLRSVMTSSSLMNAVEVTGNVEAAYRQMMHRNTIHSADGLTHTTGVRMDQEISTEFMHLLNEGHFLFRNDRYDEAVGILLQAAAKEPTSARCRLMLGSALLSIGKPEEALHHFRHLLRLESRHLAELGDTGSDAFCLAATAAYECGREEYAFELCGQALEHSPDNFMARFKRCLFTLKMCAAGEDVESVRKRYAAQLDALVSVDLDADHRFRKAIGAIGEMTPFLLAYLGVEDRSLQETYGKWLCRLMYRKYGDTDCRRSGDPEHRKVRVGFASAHFYNHSVWKIVTSGWLKNLDRSKFELFAYYPGTTIDQATELARSLTAGFVRTTDIDELVRTIRKDELDVLIYPGIGMDPYVQQLAALRLAPVQCASWGHPITTGMPTIDFFLSSDLMEPEDAADNYSEKLVRLPNLSVCYAEIIPALDAEVGLLPNVSPDEVLYLCCQNLYKYLPQHDDLFPAIASKVPNARFIFVNTHPALNKRFMDRMGCAFAGYGLSAEKHILILPKMTTSRYNTLNSIIDIYLDNPEWSGGNTTLESLPFNKPIVTMPGRFMRGRHTTAILRMMDVTETIAGTKEEFIALAVRLANDPAFRTAVSGRIMKNKHKIYDDISCIKALESFLKEQTMREVPAHE